MRKNENNSYGTVDINYLRAFYLEEVQFRPPRRAGAGGDEVFKNFDIFLCSEY